MPFSIQSPGRSKSHWLFSLPPEILVRILYFSLSDSPFNYIPLNQHGDVDLTLCLARMTTPFTLGAVCRYWRRIVWGDPNMWNSIYFVANPHKVDIQVMLLENWLSRTGNLFLSIDIDASCDWRKKWSSEFAGESKRIMGPVFRHNSRCKSFRTRLPPQCLLPPSENLNIHGPFFRGLTTLEVVPMFVTEGVDDEEDGELDTVSIFRSSASLRQLSLGEINFDQIQLPWPSVLLTTISTRNISLNDCLRLLKNAPNVETCTLKGIGYPEIDFDESHNVNLGRLRTLFLDFTEITSPYEIIFRHTTAPNLRKLQFLAESAAPFPTQEFVVFLQRSNCPLADLEIKWASMTTGDVRSCLSLVHQSLVTVEIEIVSNAWGQVITRQIPPSPLFPRIQTATLKGPSSIIKELLPSPQ